MKIKIIIYLLFIGFMFIGSFGGIIFYYNTSINVLQEQINEYLGAIAQSRERHVHDFLEQEKENLNVLTRDHHFPDLLLGLTERSPLYRQFNLEHYEEVLENAKRESYYEIFILDNKGMVISSSDKNNIGLDKSNDDYFLNAKEVSYVKDAHYFEAAGKNSIAVSAPIKHEETNELLGVIVARIETTFLNNITTDRTGLGETGEIYLINKDIYMITPSRFLPKELTFLKQKVDSVNSRDCFIHVHEFEEEGYFRHEETYVFEDYRGVEVLGTHVYIPEMDWCLLVEIDEREAVGVLRDELIKSGLLVLISISILVGIFVVVLNRFLLGTRE